MLRDPSLNFSLRHEKELGMCFWLRLQGSLGVAWPALLYTALCILQGVLIGKLDRVAARWSSGLGSPTN